MIRLTAEQQQALEALALRRDLQRLGTTVTQAFPAVDARLGERKAALLEMSWQRASALGLSHGLAVARYLAAWFIFGAEFETKPGYEWALKLLAQPERPEGQRVFQLGRRIREELQRQSGQAAHGLPTAADFDAAMAQLDAALSEQGRMGSLLPRERLRLGSACDIDAVDITLIEPAPLQHYAIEQGQWRRVPTVLDPEKLRVVGLQGQEPLPVQLNLLSLSEGGSSQLRLRCRAAHVCDPAVHPLVDFNGVHGQYERRGPLTQDLQITLPLEAGPPQPLMAVEGGASYSRLGLAGCGLRESGAPMGEQSVRLAIYPAEQTMLAWRRDAGPALRMPAEPIARAPEPRARLERDGQVLDARRWQAGLAELDAQLNESLAGLLIAWERESGVSDGRLQAEPAVLTGAAALTWGWAPSPEGLAALPFYRVAGLLDLVACQLNLRLSGELALLGSRSLLQLHCGAREVLHFNAQRGPRDEDLMAVFKPAKVEFRHPFVLHLENIATPELALLDQAGPVGGAVVGAVGLRQHPSEPGFQWFARIAIEPASVALHLHDPVLGQQRGMIRPLLPAMTLLDWSLS